MNINSILSPERTFCNIETRSKKNAIEKAAALIADTLSSLDANEIYSKLIAREKLGPTALGQGIALPHCRIEGCDSIVGALFTISTPIDFGALDDQPVNIMFVLLVPEEEVDEHLKTMAMLAARFDSEEYRSNLVNASDSQDLFDRACLESGGQRH
jgi:nitrogen PTS system EIIA component